MHWHCTWALKLLDVCPYLSAFTTLFCFARHCTWALELLDMCPYLSTFVYFFFYNLIVGERNLIHECLHCKHQEISIELQGFVYYFCFANLVNKNWFSYCACLVYLKKKNIYIYIFGKSKIEVKFLKCYILYSRIRYKDNIILPRNN